MRGEKNEAYILHHASGKLFLIKGWDRPIYKHLFFIPCIKKNKSLDSHDHAVDTSGWGIKNGNTNNCSCPAAGQFHLNGMNETMRNREKRKTTSLDGVLYSR